MGLGQMRAKSRPGCLGGPFWIALFFLPGRCIFLSTLSFFLAWDQLVEHWFPEPVKTHLSGP